MSKLNIDQKSIKLLLSDKKADFLIPDYQRPYAWGDLHCQTLWEDIFSFTFPDNNKDAFDTDGEYFLGSIVTFKNGDGKLEVIDGQQRLTTLMLLLRAFYEKFGNMQDEASKNAQEMISKCIWKTDEFDKADKNVLKIDSEVATDDDKEEFREILRTGQTKKGQKSIYANNYRLFQKSIDDFLKEYPSYFPYLPTRILNNCILLPIEAESQDTALRIFSTLNDRGLPLSDADIFKTQFYKFFKDKDSKDQFIKRWKELEKRCMGVFQKHSVPMDELFTRYMYYERARQGIKGSTTAGLRKFYEKDKYRLLKSEETLKNLELLADFWHDVSMQDKERFSDERILKYFFVLNDAPNAMWTFFVSVYFLHNKDDDGHLETEKFVRFLTKTIAFVWTQAILGRGIGALRTPMFAEMVNIVQGKQVEFSNDKFEREQTESALRTGDFPNRRPITRAMLSWWAFADPSQELLPTGTMFETEHIVSKKRQDAEALLNNSNNLESLGNKILLEEGINIRASDYRFSDKKKYYQGFTDGKGKNHQGSKVAELLQLCDQTDFIEADIEERKEKIIDWFMRFLEDNGLLKN